MTRNAYTHRATQPLNRTDPERLAAAVRRDLAQGARIQGDLCADEIDQKFQAAMAVIRRRRLYAPDAA